MKFITRDNHQPAKGLNCIIGLPSVGNVGQIAADHILVSLHKNGSVRRVGCIESSLVLPMTGYFEFTAGKPELCLPIEVWEVASKKTLIILQRSLCVKGSQKEFTKMLYKLVTEELCCSSVVVLTGAATEGVEPSMSRSLFAHVDSTTGASQLKAAYPALYQSPALVCSTVPPLPEWVHNAVVQDADVAHGNSTHLYEFQPGYDHSSEAGSAKVEEGDELQRALAAVLPLGMTAGRYLLEEAVRHSHTATTAKDATTKAGSAGAVEGSNSLPAAVCVLGKYCAEGDNLPDGRQLGDFVLTHLLEPAV